MSLFRRRRKPRHRKEGSFLIFRYGWRAELRWLINQYRYFRKRRR